LYRARILHNDAASITERVRVGLFCFEPLPTSPIVAVFDPTTTGGVSMRLSHFCAALVAAAAIATAAPGAAQADSGRISLTIYKGGWFIGGEGGSGTLTFRGRKYRLSVGGVSAGLVFGGSKTTLHGIVRNIRRPSDVSGVYGAGGAGAAVGRGARMMVLQNNKGAILEVQGRQVGLMANADLTGLAISMR
jgi:hypothetical protein